MPPAPRFVLTPTARHGLLSALEYVDGAFGAAVAVEVLDRLETEFRRIAQFPDIGHQREDLTDDGAVRFRSVGPTLIAYRAAPIGVEILFVERASREWRNIVD